MEVLGGVRWGGVGQGGAGAGWGGGEGVSPEAGKPGF